MAHKLKLILSLSDSNPAPIDAFVKEFGPLIQSFVHINGGKEEDVRSILQDLVSDLYLKIKAGFDFGKYKVDPLIMSLSILLYKKRKIENSKDKSPLIIKQEYYELNRVKLSIEKYRKQNEKCESVLKNLGEPGRTIMDLTFNKKDSDESIVQHLHFDSVEQLKVRRIKLLDRCIENLAL